MPKQRITEIDTTGILSLAPVSKTVYVPAKSDRSAKPVLYSTAKQLENSDITYRDKAFKLSRYLLNLGLEVLYEEFAEGKEPDFEIIKDKTLYDVRFVTAGDFGKTYKEAIECAATRGDCVALCDHTCDVEPINEYEAITKEPADWDTAVNKYYRESDQITEDDHYTTYDKVDFTPGETYAKEGSVYYCLAKQPADWSEETREDYYRLKTLSELFDEGLLVTKEAEEEFEGHTWYLKREIPAPSEEINAEWVRDYFEDALGGFLADADDQRLKYAAAFTPWFSTRIYDITGDATGKEEIFVPASFAYLFAYAKSINRNNPEWYAISGSFRGAVTEVSELTHDFTNAECEILQARAADDEVDLDDPGDNVGFAINPITNVRPFGYLIWGNRTLMNNQEDTDKTGLLKATSFLNVRQLVSTLSKAMYDTARKYTFEQNTEILWNSFQMEVDKVLDRMQSGNGILGYRWRRVPTNKKARVKAILRIIPIEAVEDFDLTIELSDFLEVSEG